MKILISNDDGISSRGIQVLAKYLSELGDVIVVAPSTEQSAVGHAITMKVPVRVKEFYMNGKMFGYAVDGTPADCIKMGIKNILQEKPDIVVSGINNGSNAAINIIYSGTVSAAREAAIMDVPSIAVSVTNHKPKSFEFAGKIAQKIVKHVYKHGLTNGTLLNVNVPDVPEDEIKGIKLTTQGNSKWDDSFEERHDPYGGSYFWLRGDFISDGEKPEADISAIADNYVSVTPIHFDLTDYETLENIKHWDLEKEL